MQVDIRDHLVLQPELFILEVRLHRLVFLLVDRRERVLRSCLGDDLEIERTSGGSTHARANAREDTLVDIRELDERRLFGDEEDVFFEDEEIALYSLEVRFDPRVAITTIHPSHHRSNGPLLYIRTS